MALPHILLFSVFSLIVGGWVPVRWRGWMILISSVVALYWMQPSTPLRNWDFWLPTLSVILVVWVWFVTRPVDPAVRKLQASDWVAMAVILSSVLVIATTRYLGPDFYLTPSRPPDMVRVLLLLGLGAVLAFVTYRLGVRSLGRKILPWCGLFFFLLIFILLKNNHLATGISAVIRQLSTQPADLAQASDLSWLGFSYLAFRLMHVLRDYQSGRLPQVNLGEFINYALFFPAITAGPIDRLPRFIQDWRKISSGTGAVSVSQVDWGTIFEGCRRILIGIFKKFALADTLALFSLSSQNAPQVSQALWMWLLLYAYSLRIYLDFSGYTDIAIGLGKLLGIHLPENFDRPYLKQNITAFWNSWHITLAQWFRAYFFNPLTRSLRSYLSEKMPVWIIILISQVSTMGLIGLWHGITLNFLIWGAWHGMGLFLHNCWGAWVRPHLPNLNNHPWLQRFEQVICWFLTFNFVVLGWVWFALPSPALAWEVLRKLFNL